ncbi:MAG: Protease HtpX [Chlamydiae bacterium]|nr:Protease HtpX [Chlamydiota bacterium]
MKKLLLALFLFFGAYIFAGECDFIPVAVPPPTPEATSYYRSGNLLWVVSFLYSLAVPALLLFTGFSAMVRSFCNRIASRWLWQVGLFALLFLLSVALLNLPLDFYSGYIRPHSYGMSNLSLGLWFQHFLIGTGITTLLGIILVWLLYAIIRKSPKRWWLYFGLLTFPLTVFLVVIQPIWIAPLTHRFRPMEDVELKAKIMRLAEKAGIEGSRIYVVNMSQDTNAINAYVTGIGTSKRIVLWDTTIEKLDDEQILFIMGHEMGHYVLNHMWWGLLVITLLSIVTFLIVFLMAEFFLRHRPRRFGFTALSDVASLPLIILLYTFFSVLLSPLWNLYSQSIEHDADIFGLELTHLNQAAGKGFVKLQSNNLGYPWPGEFYMLFRSGHPSTGSRIVFFNGYKPWCDDKPLKYGKYFRGQ